jgi:hypothetical protein
MLNLETTIQAQFANSPTLMRLIQNMNAYIDPSADINMFYSLIMNVDTAVDYGLDVWGRIVGVGRVLQLQSIPYFGFSGPYGASGQPWNQAPFYNGEVLTSNFALSDAAYRSLILAKALFNITNSTIPAINQVLINLFGPGATLALSPAGVPYCTDGLNMTMTYTFPSSLNPVQSAIVYQSGVLPRPAGVLATVVLPSYTLVDEAGNVLKDEAGNILTGSTL